LRHTSLLPGQFPANKRDNRPVSCAGNANSLNCRAVIVHSNPVPDPQIDLDKRTITQIHFINLILYPVTNPTVETDTQSGQ
jgi:hypothetical protein